MKDDEACSAQECLELTESRFAMFGHWWKQNEERSFQLGFKGSKCFTMWSKWWRMQGFLVVFEGFSKSSKNAKLQERREWSFSVLWLWFPRVQMTENFPYVVCLKPFNQMVNLFMLNDTFCNFANWHVSGERRYKAGRFGLGTGWHRPLQMLFWLYKWNAVLVLLMWSFLQNFQVLQFWSKVIA